MLEENAEKENSITIIFENEDLVVINKPSGILVHNDGHNDTPTVVDWFLKRVPEAQDVGEYGRAQDGTLLERSGVVHRLDADTSGVMIFAKTQDSFESLKEQFHDRLAKKEYRAFVYGTMKEKWGTIDRPIGRSTKNFKLKSAQRGAKGTLRDAVTDWELIGQNDTYAYLKLFPKTGRTHQIRVHLKAIGRPVVGDRLYAPQNLLETESLGFDRLALHAYKLNIVLPTGESREFISPVPESFERAEVSLAT